MKQMLKEETNDILADGRDRVKKTNKKTRKKKLRCVAGILLVVAIIWVIYYGNLSLQTTVYEIVIGQEHADLDGFTIVQISDLHNARFGNEQSCLLQAVAEQEPDLIPVAGSKNVKEKYSISAVFLFLLKNRYKLKFIFSNERIFY